MPNSSKTEEESKMMMEDLSINDGDETTSHRTNTNEDDSEMSLDERMNWLRERVRELLVALRLTGFFIYYITLLSTNCFYSFFRVFLDRVY